MKPRALMTVLIFSLVAAPFLLASTAPPAQADVPTVQVPMNGVKVIRVGSGINRVVLGDTSFIRIRAISSQEILAFGMSPGVTTLHVWTDAGMRRFWLQVQRSERGRMDDESRNILRKIGELDSTDQELRVITPQYRDVSDFETYIRNLLQDDGQILLSDEVAGKIFVLGDPQILDKVQALLDQLDVPGEDVMYTRRVIMENRPVTELVEKVKAMLSGQGTVIPDEETNSFWISDNVSTVKRITQFLRNIDVQTVAQVQIKAKFVELTDEAEEKLGIDWRYTGLSDNEVITSQFGQNPNQILQATAANVPRQLEVNLDTIIPPGLDATLRALEQQGLVNLISSPQVLTRNQQQALLEIVNEQTYVSSWNVSTDDGTLNVTPVVDTVTGGITLEVTPLIGTRDVIQMKVRPELKIVDIGQPIIQQAEGSSFPFFTPEVDRRTAELNLALKDGQTLVIGGLNRQESESTETKVPLLGDIPVLGHLFTHREDRETTTNISIFLTAEIIRLQQGEINGQAQTGSDTQARVILEDDTSDLSLPPELQNAR